MQLLNHLDPNVKAEIPPGVLAVTTYGAIQPETTQSLVDLVRHNATAGISNVHYTMVQGHLVDKARNEGAKMMLANPTLKYLLFIDADMTFTPDVMQKLLLTAYHPQMCQWADVVGAWCPLRGKPYLPTIDTGTGTWEPHDANVGPLEVIRTGSACILIKRHVYERMEFPWYGVRPAPRPIDVLAELDNYARCKMDGTNPLREHAAWATLEKCAREDAAAQRTRPEAQVPGGFFSSVGEDSNFCDKVRALGMRIVVQTDAVCGHLDRQTIKPEMHTEAMRESERLTRLSVGVLE
jgi:hypothetical protein